jgi:hypothetical protein
MVDEFELRSYSLKDFKLRSLGKDSVLVMYMAHYEGKAGDNRSRHCLRRAVD